MVVLLPEAPTSSLPSIDQPTVSKVLANELEPDNEIHSAIITAQNSGIIVQNYWPNCITRIFNWGDELGQYVKRFIAYLASKFYAFFRPDQFVYEEPPLSAETKLRLEHVGRKTLVLDLDETLVHSCYIDPDTHEIVGCTFVPETAVPDYVLTIRILADVPPVEFQVFKRPHVDEFLDLVGKWYDVVIYTASLEAYASHVVDKLDAGRGILTRRYYRQHCLSQPNFLSKNLYVVNRDLTKIFIIDNSPSAYRDFPENAIPIKTYIYDPDDMELVNMLPFLDALRFTKDVRTILSRRQVSTPVTN